MKPYGCSAANWDVTLWLQCCQLSDEYRFYSAAALGYILSPSVYLRFYLQLHFVKGAYFSRGVCFVSTVLRPAQLCWLGQVFILQPKELPI
jgi:hypothetical protein